MSFSNIRSTDYDRGHLVAIIKHFVQTTIRRNAQSIDIYRQVLDAYDRDDPYQLEDLMLYWLLNKHDLKNFLSEFETDVILAKKSSPYQYSVSEFHSLPSSAENLIKEVKEMIEDRKKFIRSQIEIMLELIKFWRGIDCESGSYLIPLANLFSTSSFDNILEFERDVMAPWGKWSRNGPFSSESSEYGRVITIPQLQQYLQEVPVIVVPEGVSPEKVQKLDIVFREMHSLTKQMNEQNKNWTTTLLGRNAVPYDHAIYNENVLHLTSNQGTNHGGESQTIESSSRQNPDGEAGTVENDSLTAIMKNMNNLSLGEAGEARQGMANTVPGHTAQPAKVSFDYTNAQKLLMEQRQREHKETVMLVNEFTSYRFMKENDKKDELNVGIKMRLLFGEKMGQYRRANVSPNIEASRKEASEYVRCRLEELRLERADHSEGPSKGIESTKHRTAFSIEETSAVLAKYSALLQDCSNWNGKTVAMLLMLKTNSEDETHIILEHYCLFTALA